MGHIIVAVALQDAGEGDLATDGLQIPAVTMTNAHLKPVEWWENRPMY